MAYISAKHDISKNVLIRILVQDQEVGQAVTLLLYNRDQNRIMEDLLRK